MRPAVPVVTREVPYVPEPGQADSGHRPGRVEAVDVPVHHRGGGAQAEQHPERPVRLQRVTPRRLPVGGAQAEAGEEPEAVLARERLSASGARPGDVQGAGLAAEDGVVLVVGHGVAALGEFLRGAQTGDTSAEDGDPLPGRRRGDRAPALP